MCEDSNISVDYQFSFYKRPITNTIPENLPVSLEQVFKLIQDSDLKDNTEKIRKESNKDLRNKLKRSTLPYVTFSGIFSSRKDDALIKHSGLICIDLDRVNEPGEAKRSIREVLSPALIFRSPSGNGLKVVFAIDLHHGDHMQYFKSIRSYFRTELSLQVDNGSDISRACFLCHDPDVCFSNEPVELDTLFLETYGDSSDKKENKTESGQVAEEFISLFQPSDELFRQGKTWIESKEVFKEGNRHIFITELAGFLHRTGMDKSHTFIRLQEFAQDGFTSKEIEGIVNRIYTNSAFTGKSPLKQKYSSADYVSFPLKELYGPPELIGSRADMILSQTWPPIPGIIPTSVKRDYLVEAREGKLNPEYLLLLAAVKSILGKRNFTRTTNATVFKRMMGIDPWRKFTRYWMDKLFTETMMKNMLTKVSGGPGCKGYYVSIRYRPEELSKKIKKMMLAYHEKKERTKKAADEIAEFRKTLKKKKPEDPLKRYPFPKSDDQQSFDKPFNNVSAP